ALPGGHRRRAQRGGVQPRGDRPEPGGGGVLAARAGLLGDGQRVVPGAGGVQPHPGRARARADVVGVAGAAARRAGVDDHGSPPGLAGWAMASELSPALVASSPTLVEPEPEPMWSESPVPPPAEPTSMSSMNRSAAFGGVMPIRTRCGVLR